MTSKIDLRGCRGAPTPCPFKSTYNVGCLSVIKYNPDISVQYVCMCDIDEKRNPECYSQVDELSE